MFYLPTGYQLFEGFNCYKTYSDYKSWSDAREQCKRDGGDLMVLESERERSEVFPTMYTSVGYWDPWMGVYKPEGEDRWVSVRGEPALSSWWRPGYPDNTADRKCAVANGRGPLWNYRCAHLRSFICEIPL
ncbi:C-type lectin domain family 17, member A-like [Anabrus simplex]|uniref:C-type lectin domain family 17, member A-like n=1 Tax=Anabrus simplex TaxID=316456 RepID=UPI0035A26CEB